jgi:hypothetical protein
MTKWIFQYHALTDELGIKITREGHALAVDARGHEQKCSFSPCLLGQKAWREVSKSEYYRGIAIGGTKHGRDTGY